MSARLPEMLLLYLSAPVLFCLTHLAQPCTQQACAWACFGEGARMLHDQQPDEHKTGKGPLGLSPMHEQVSVGRLRKKRAKGGGRKHLRGRVIATFSRRSSPTNPMLPCELHRTVEKTTTSASLPCPCSNMSGHALQSSTPCMCSKGPGLPVVGTWQPMAIFTSFRAAYISCNAWMPNCSIYAPSAAL